MIEQYSIYSYKNEVWTFKPVFYKDQIQLYDIFDPAGDWHGSKMTIKQCKEYVYYCYNRK